MASIRCAPPTGLEAIAGNIPSPFGRSICADLVQVDPVHTVAQSRRVSPRSGTACWQATCQTEGNPRQRTTFFCQALSVAVSAFPKRRLIPVVRGSCRYCRRRLGGGGRPAPVRAPTSHQATRSKRGKACSRQSAAVPEGRGLRAVRLVLPTSALH